MARRCARVGDHHSDFRLLFTVGSSHRGVATLVHPGDGQITMDVTPPSIRWRQFAYRLRNLLGNCLASEQAKVKRLLLDATLSSNQTLEPTAGRRDVDI